MAIDLFETLDEMVISTRFSHEGAFDTQSSIKSAVQFVMNKIAFTEKDVFVDVGCGVGKVLYMLQNPIKFKIIGIEIDPLIAEIARNRVKGRDNVYVVTGNVLDCKAEIQDATVFYLYNPFDLNILERFLVLVKEIGRKDVRIIYVNAVGIQSKRNLLS